MAGTPEQMLRVQELVNITIHTRTLDEWFHLVRRKKRMGRKLTKALREEKSKVIAERVERILEAESSNPRLFFQKANPDKTKRIDAILEVRESGRIVRGLKAVGNTLAQLLGQNLHRIRVAVRLAISSLARREC